MAASRDAAYFEQMYRNDPDPWDFTTSPYERQKYAATLGALGSRHFAAGLEIGCSIGVLTEHLAARCDTMLGIDIAPTALAAAKTRCAHLAHVRFGLMAVPGEFPEAKFDLIVLSEVLYFLCESDIEALAAKIGQALLPHAMVLLVHYTGSTDYPCTGDQAVMKFIEACPQLRSTLHRREERYRVDVLRG